MRRGLSFAGARVLITGGASGLGRRMALLAAERGAHVIVWDRDWEGAARVAAEVGGSSAPVDVTEAGAVTLAAACGNVDVLINNAGVVTGKPLLEASEAQIRRTFEVNALAPYWTTRALLPGMLARGRGAIVTVASAAGLVGVAKQTDYSASKWAAIGFTESLRAELRKAKSPVRTLVVAPYYIDTGMFEGVTTRFPRLLPILQEEDVARRVLDAVESGREQLILPWLARVMPGSRILPSRAFDRLMDFFGINETMDRFVGRTPNGGVKSE